jgi:hypothetical protein
MAATLVALLAAPGVGHADPSPASTVTRDIYTNFFFPTCAGEDILFEGQIQTVSRTFTDAAGGMHGSLMVTLIDVSGVGQATGTQYRFVSVTTFTVNFLDPFGGSTGVIRARVVSRDGVVLFQDFSVHVTITPDGEIVVLRIEEESGCRSSTS